ncbi:hypothetical protein DAVIS_04029 [Mycobacterium marinum]|uniref:Transposase n=1 Tax=Mycobacterium marinum TaxID=1781 RepID=A0A3E2MRR5_MYCMR|nr:hypothetical protein [Mycobacterium marinum]RFZ36303.1 hypothetical protein DAVIS_04029 [Mycobacterium marinum]GJO52818.1 hypothetical protein NJB1604_42910 [Mycobacterium marinum]
MAFHAQRLISGYAGTLGAAMRRWQTGRGGRSRMPRRTSKKIEQEVLSAWRHRQRGAVVLAAELGLNPSTVGRILARHAVPHLCAVGPFIGAALRRWLRSSDRYEHRTPESLVYVDVKKPRSNPERWRMAAAPPRCRGLSFQPVQKDPIRYDYIHTAIDDHTRLA